MCHIPNIYIYTYHIYIYYGVNFDNLDGTSHSKPILQNIKLSKKNWRSISIMGIDPYRNMIILYHIMRPRCSLQLIQYSCCPNHYIYICIYIYNIYIYTQVECHHFGPRSNSHISARLKIGDNPYYKHRSRMSTPQKNKPLASSIQVPFKYQSLTIWGVPSGKLT